MEFSKRSAGYKFGGSIYYIRSDRHCVFFSVDIHLAVLVVVVFFGFYFQILITDWILLALKSGFVLAAEAFNTAIEIDTDLTSPEFHPFARDTKDVTAGAVLISATAAATVGLLIFGPYFLSLVTR